MSYDEEPVLEGSLEREFDELKARLNGALARAEKAEAERDAAIEGRAEVFFAAEDRERLRAWEDAARRAWSICAETAPEDCPGPDAVRAAVDRLDDDAIRFEGECVVQRARAEKAEADYRRLLSERAEANQLAGRCAHQRDTALAANAEMRAALLDWHGPPNPAHSVEHCPTCDLLARPDLGAGVVVVPREVMERCRIVINDALAHHQGGHSRIGKALRAAIADLDALLEKGGG